MGGGGLRRPEAGRAIGAERVSRTAAGERPPAQAEQGRAAVSEPAVDDLDPAAGSIAALEVGGSDAMRIARMLDQTETIICLRSVVVGVALAPEAAIRPTETVAGPEGPDPEDCKVLGGWSPAHVLLVGWPACERRRGARS